MKFCKRYREYVKGQQNLLPGLSYVEFKGLKKVLKNCRLHESCETPMSSQEVCASDLPYSTSQPSARASSCQASGSGINCPAACSVCDCTFFPRLMKGVADVSGCFNIRAQRLLQIHLASGFQKYLLRVRYKYGGNHLAMVEEGKSLVSYVSMNALAIRKILKKYDKVHFSMRGRAFKTRLQTMNVELLQSPWLIELIAFHINLKDGATALPEMLAECSYEFDSSKPSISCTMHDSMKVDIDLTCSICLEMVFDPVSLRCGHIFCNSCACSAASILTVEGLKAADQNSKCPLCRQVRVYADAVHLTELATLISTRCKGYWKERLQRERVDRLQQAKDHWEHQCRTAVGF